MSTKKDGFSVDTGGVNALLTGLSGRFDGENADQRPNDGTTAERHDGMTAGMPEQPAAPAKPRKPSKYTLLLDQDDALALDQLALALRRRTGRAVDKSEILRALIRLTDQDDRATDTVARALDRRTNI